MSYRKWPRIRLPVRPIAPLGGTELKVMTTTRGGEHDFQLSRVCAGQRYSTVDLYEL